MSTEIEHTAAATAILARHGVPVDVQELLLRGDGRGVVPPGVLAKVLATVRADGQMEGLEMAARHLEEYRAPREEYGHAKAAVMLDVEAIRALIEHATPKSKEAPE